MAQLLNTNATALSLTHLSPQLLVLIVREHNIQALDAQRMATSLHMCVPCTGALQNLIKPET